MISLDYKQQVLLFDYCVGLADAEESIQAEALIASNPEAAKLYESLKASVSPLDMLETEEACPDHLVERTVLLLKNAADTGQRNLELLLESEHHRRPLRGRPTHSSRFWRNVGELVAAAAVIIFFGGLVVAPLSRIRQNYWKQCCQGQLAGIFGGMSNYSDDHDGELPLTAFSAGTPWWKVGYQGQENHSNTRRMWMLVKQGYVKPTDFVCPGKRQGRALPFDSAMVEQYNDFPARRYVTYSFRIMCDKSKSPDMLGRKVLAADSNPLFEELPSDYSRQLLLKLNDKLLSLNSVNHHRSGQCVLFCDGSAKFVGNRLVDDISKDDIFTLRDTQIYKGVEVPSCEADDFLAP